MSDSQGFDSETDESIKNETFKASMYRFLGVIYYVFAIGSLLFGLYMIPWSCEISPITGRVDFAGPLLFIIIISPALHQLGKNAFSKSSHFAKEPVDIEAFPSDMATYLIDFDSGTTPICDLPIGSRVIDPTWLWNKKAIVWILVAKDHYEGMEPHVTLLAEDLVGEHHFDNSSDSGHESLAFSHNHWGASGTTNATCGLRPWLNSTGIHSGEGFYRVLSESFKSAVLNTTLPNKQWQIGSAYSTNDHVFTPSTTELGDTDHNSTYQIGSAYPYFQGMDDTKRLAKLNGKTTWYWTRSPGSLSADHLYGVSSANVFIFNRASYDILGVRPAVNLKSEILVSEIKD